MRISRWIACLLALCVMAPLVIWLLELSGIWHGFRGPRPMLTVLIIAMHLLALFGSMRAIEMRQVCALMWSGFIVGVFSMFAWLMEAYYLLPGRGSAIDDRAMWFGLASTWAGFCGVTGLALLSRIPSPVVVFARRATIVCLSLLAANVAYIIAADHSGSTAIRLMWALVVLSLLGLACTRLTTGMDHELAGPVERRWLFAARCPRCGESQRLVTGGTVCLKCGLTIRVLIR